MDSVPPCSRRATPEIRLGAGHWVFAIPDATDRQIELEPVARQCILYFQFACVINSIVRALLEIGKHAELQLCSRVPATRRASPLPARATGNRRGASALELDSEARPRSLQRVAVDGRGRAASGFVREFDAVDARRRRRSYASRRPPARRSVRGD